MEKNMKKLYIHMCIYIHTHTHIYIYKLNHSAVHQKLKKLKKHCKINYRVIL